MSKITCDFHGGEHVLVNNNFCMTCFFEGRINSDDERVDFSEHLSIIEKQIQDNTHSR